MSLRRSAPLIAGLTDGNVITVSELRKELPAVLHRVLAFNESFTVLKHGQAFARLAPILNPHETSRLEQKLKDGLTSVTSSDEVLEKHTDGAYATA